MSTPTACCSCGVSSHHHKDDDGRDRELRQPDRQTALKRLEFEWQLTVIMREDMNREYDFFLSVTFHLSIESSAQSSVRARNIPGISVYCPAQSTEWKDKCDFLDKRMVMHSPRTNEWDGGGRRETSSAQLTPLNHPSSLFFFYPEYVGGSSFTGFRHSSPCVKNPSSQVGTRIYVFLVLSCWCLPASS